MSRICRNIHYYNYKIRVFFYFLYYYILCTCNKFQCNYVIIKKHVILAHTKKIPHTSGHFHFFFREKPPTFLTSCTRQRFALFFERERCRMHGRKGWNRLFIDELFYSGLLAGPGIAIDENFASERDRVFDLISRSHEVLVCLHS